MTRFLAGLVLAIVASWLFDRLWPALRTEPATWLGDKWQTELRARLGV